MLSDQPATSCFSVYAPSDPAVLPRVLGVFARQDVVPSRVVAARLRNLVDVSLVLTSEKAHYRAA